MPSSQAKRRVVFALAVLALLAGSAASALTGSAVRRAAPGAARPARSMPEAPRISAARSVALRFLGAYLAYEAGQLGPRERDALAATATARLAGELTGSPVRAPPGRRAPAPRLRRLLGARVDLFEAEPALTVAALVGGAGEAHVLRLTLVRWGVGWRVAGVGR